MSAKILIIDHNDSFTYNLVGLFESARDGRGNRLVAFVEVWPVDQLPAKDLEEIWRFDAIVLSPGPGLPKDYPAVFRLLKYCLKASGPMPVLGVCLGLQTLVTYFGGALYNLPRIQHGRQVDVYIESSNNALALFEGLSVPLKAGLYHSWGMDTGIIVPGLEVLATARIPDIGARGEQAIPARPVVMAVGHKSLPVCGLQFHPESYMTPEGSVIISNWLGMATR